MGVHVDPVLNGESVMSVQTQKEGKDLSGGGVGGLGQLLPNGLTVPGKGIAGPGQMKNGSGGMNGTQTGAALANGHR